MKNYLFFLVMILWYPSIFSQIPTGYYDGTGSLNGYALKTKLSQIISQGYVSHSYSDLWQEYQYTDEDHYYENDGSILDVYSENPNGADSYEFSFSSDQCGSYSAEGSCYNREHLVPQSWFNEAMPMKSDINHIYPTDGYVNNRRGNYCFGEVQNPTWTSSNGSKLGPNSYNYAGAYTGTVFEPIDAFKGDIARVYFYMATRYESQVGNWAGASPTSAATFDGSSDHVFTDWMIDMLLKWNQEDPVSQREIDRNNAVYQYQGNRNPFIDHPEFAEKIWGNSSSGTDSTSNNNPNIIFTEDFNNCSSVSNTFSIVNEMSAENWHCSNNGQGQSGTMSMYGFANNTQDPSIDWLISKPINLNQSQITTLSFNLTSVHGNSPLQLLYSTDYEGYGIPSSFTWQTVPGQIILNHYGNDADTLYHTYDSLDISSITGSAVRFAFKYQNDTSNIATLWSVDNFQIKSNATSASIKAVAKTKFLVYPNPSSKGYITVQTSNHIPFDYAIFNEAGAKVMEGNSAIGSKKISTANIRNGFYIIRIKTQSAVVSKRLILR